MKKRHSEEQISRILQESELREVPIRDLYKQHDVLASHVLPAALLPANHAR